MWVKKVPLFLFFYLVLFLFSSPCFSQTKPEEMTDAEIIAELMDNLKKRETSITEKESSIQTRENRLQEREQELTQRETNYQEKLSILETRKLLLIETESYWKNYKSDTIKDKLIAAGIGFAFGFAAGNYTGFRIGFTVQY